MLVEFYSNNSGGIDWLTDEDWNKLREYGWEVSGFSGTFFDGRMKYARKEFPSIKCAIAEWETILGYNASERGCPCCGPPHEFMEV